VFFGFFVTGFQKFSGLVTSTTLSSLLFSSISVFFCLLICPYAGTIVIGKLHVHLF
jgi:hypothetical protein